MSLFKFVITLGIAWTVHHGWHLRAVAQDAAPAPEVSELSEETEGDEADEADAPEAPVTKSKSKSKSRQRPHGQLEGTKARDRFEAITVIKSKYQKGGKSLDVDPD